MNNYTFEEAWKILGQEKEEIEQKEFEKFKRLFEKQILKISYRGLMIYFLQDM